MARCADVSDEAATFVVMRALSRWLPAALLSLAACGDPRPRFPDPEPLPAAVGDSLLVPVNDLTTAVALSRDIYAVLSVDDAVVHLADFGASTVTLLGRGAPPELKHPYAIFTQADTLFITDWDVGRVTAWSPTGTLLRTAITRAEVGVTLPTARDAAGQFFAERAPNPGQDGSGNKDSAAVIRYRGTTVDTVARLSPLDLSPVQSTTGVRFERRLLSGQDRWGVLPDGSIWTARVYKNRVDWTDAKGGRTEGQLLPDRVLEVTNVDRELMLRKFPPEQRSQVEQLPFAAIKPPFEMAWTGSDGSVWIEKSRADNDTTRQYQIVDRRGDFVRLITIAGRGRIFAERDGQVLTAERIATGMLLRRAPLPAPLPAAPAAN